MKGEKTSRASFVCYFSLVMNTYLQAIKKVLDENFECEEELQSQATESQATLYKNLWLEAEAELCFTSYRTRFDRVKTEMEKCKLGRIKGKITPAEPS